MALPPGYEWLFSKETGLLTLALSLALSLATLWLKTATIREKDAIIREKDAQIGKLTAETRKIEVDTLAPEREARKSERERIQDCARNIEHCVSATVDELNATFGPFRNPPDDVNPEKLQETLRVAKRFRQEQRYRVDAEKHVGELRALADGTEEEALARLHELMRSILAKISDKKIYVANIETGGLTPENVKAVGDWLDEIRETQVSIAALVGAICGRLSLAEDRGAEVDRAA